MSPPFLTVASTMMCPHGGTVIATPSSTRASAGGAPILTVADTCVIAGCVFNIAGVPNPCVTVQWAGAATRVTASGTPVLTAASIGLCLAATQAPQGAVIIASTQTQASGE